MSKTKTWAERLDAAEKRGWFTVDDDRRVRPWTSCAVGEHRGEYTEADHAYYTGVPASEKLLDLGAYFASQVTGDSILAARQTYDRIQAWFRRYGKRVKP